MSRRAPGSARARRADVRRRGRLCSRCEFARLPARNLCRGYRERLLQAALSGSNAKFEVRGLSCCVDTLF